MRVFALVLVTIVASACLAHVQANVLDSIKDKIEDAKDSVVGAVTGKHEEEHKEGEHAKSDEKDDDEEHHTYEGGLGKQIAHSVADAALDRLTDYGKEHAPSSLLKPVISLAASKVKENVHERINEYGESDEEKKESEEGKKNEGLMDVLSRRRRSIEPVAKKAPSGVKRLLGGIKGLFHRKGNEVKKPVATTEAPARVHQEAKQPAASAEEAQQAAEPPKSTHKEAEAESESESKPEGESEGEGESKGEAQQETREVEENESKPEGEEAAEEKSKEQSE